jgi:hypothetical protein
MAVLAQLAALIGSGPAGQTRQLEAIQQFFSDPTDQLVAAHIVLHRRRLIFIEQHITRLARLLVLHGADRPYAPGTDEECWMMQRAYIGMGSLREGSPGSPPPTRDQAIAWLVQAGAYNSTEPLMEALQRVYAIYVELASRADLKEPRIPLGEWARSDQGLDIEQQWGLALAAFGRSRVLDDDASPIGRGFLPPDWIGQFAAAVGAAEDTVGDALVADRAWYMEQFSPTAGDRRHALWNRVPFEQRPLLRLSDGQLIVVSPRALLSWLTDGFYHRAFNSARRRGDATRGRFGHHTGRLVETYALELMRSVHPGERPPGAGVVHGEQEYQHPRGRRHTPDIAIDRGEDLVLIEVCSGRLSLPTLIEGSPQRDLDLKLVGKARQLSDAIDDLLAGYVKLPDVSMDHVRRIWPLVIAPAGLLQHPMLWDFITERLDGKLTQPRVQPLTVLDLGELECLAGLVEQRTDLITILNEKAGPVYRHLDFRKLIWDDPRFDPHARASIVTERSRAMWLAAGARLGLDEDELRRLDLAEHEEAA